MPAARPHRVRLWMSALVGDPHRPAGRPGADQLSRRLREVPVRPVDEFQRARILCAMAEIAAEEGPERATVTKVVERVRLSRKAFYELFSDRQDCLRAVVHETLSRAAARVLPAYRREDVWLERLRAGLWQLLLLIEQEPALARLCLTQLYTDDPVMFATRMALSAHLRRALEEGREQVPRGMEPPALSAEATVAGALSVLHARLLERAPLEPTALLGELMGVLVLPYIGPGAARRELSLPAPILPAAPATPAPPADPPRPSELRVTYRTARVLDAIAARPGINNRDVAAAAGIRDQGQVSRLLRRLAALGLIENGRDLGASNAWQLTDDGRALSRTIGLAGGERAS